MKVKSIVVLMLTLILIGCNAADKRADLVLMNGNIVTVDDALPRAEAIAIGADTIIAVGSNDQISAWIGSATKQVDLQGKTAIPGFIDSHAHFLSLGYARMKLKLGKAGNWQEIIEMVAEAAASMPSGQWITGRGWHQDKWDAKPDGDIEGYPNVAALSRVSPDNPVILTHVSGHAIIANQKAMELAGVSKTSKDPDGGRILRYGDGRPAGVFLENAMSLIYQPYNEADSHLSKEQRKERERRAALLAQQECLRHGITSFHDAGASFDEIDMFRQLIDEDKLKLRLWVMLGESNDKIDEQIHDYRIINYGNNRLTVRAIKRFMDGALGAHGAWLFEPYNDQPQTKGLNTIPLDTFRRTARLAMKHELQLCTHAIGDRANRETLDIYEAVFAANAEESDLRWRIEHAQHLHPQDIQRFGELGVIAAMQGCMATSDGPWVPKRLGDQRAGEGAYVWQKLLNSGAHIANGTDAPVEDINPISNFYALVTRKMADGRLFYPDQCLSREQALRTYTINGAHAGFEEDFKGSITPGKLADITVLSKDIMTIPEDEILQTEVLYTIIAGKVEFKKE